jgi:hypothetical protein
MNYKEYLKHLSIVILGILIAVWINNVGMQRNERTTQKQVFLTMLNEIEDNNESVRLTLLNLDSLRTTIATVQKAFNPSDTTINVDISYKGLRLTSIGYETAKYTGILKGVNHDLISEIVINYEGQDSLEELEKILLNELFELLRSNSDYNFHYLLVQIDNFSDNLKTFELKQKTLMASLSASL